MLVFKRFDHITESIGSSRPFSSNASRKICEEKGRGDRIGLLCIMCMTLILTKSWHCGQGVNVRFKFACPQKLGIVRPSVCFHRYTSINLQYKVLIPCMQLRFYDRFRSIQLIPHEAYDKYNYICIWVYCTLCAFLILVCNNYSCMWIF